MATSDPRKSAVTIQGTGLTDCGVLLTFVSITSAEDFDSLLRINGAHVNSYPARDPVPLFGGVGEIQNINFVLPVP